VHTSIVAAASPEPKRRYADNGLISRYETALFLHVLGAFLLVGGTVLAAAALAAGRLRRRPAEIASVLRLARTGVVFVGVGSLLALGFGLWLVDLAGYGFADGWIVAALALFVLSSALGARGGRKPREAREAATRLAREGSEDATEPRRLLADRPSLVLNAAAALAMLGVLALMIFKPGAP
jgi:uncharacterized membrane protein